jgi:hypothetical protein
MALLCSEDSRLLVVKWRVAANMLNKHVVQSTAVGSALLSKSVTIPHRKKSI